MKKRILKKAFKKTLPVLTGYLVLGMGFGILTTSSGFNGIVAVAMSVFIYAGSMQFAAIGLLTGGASIITSALTTLMVNARHIFYGVSMIQRYKEIKKAKPYLIFGLTDETYSLLCHDNEELSEDQAETYYLMVTLLNHFYWVAGTVLGVLAGNLLSFNTQGIDFSLTALFVTIFVDQWLGAKGRIPAVIGVGASVMSLVIFGAESFLIPAMMIIALLLCIYREGERNDK